MMIFTVKRTLHSIDEPDRILLSEGDQIMIQSFVYLNRPDSLLLIKKEDGSTLTLWKRQLIECGALSKDDYLTQTEHGIVAMRMPKYMRDDRDD